MNIYGLFPYRFEFYRKSSSKPKLDFSNAGKPLYDTIWNKTDACSTFGNLAENNDEQTIVHPMIEYLYKWKEDRANWKFKKAKQFSSFLFKQGGCKLEGNKIRINKNFGPFFSVIGQISLDFAVAVLVRPQNPDKGWFQDHARVSRWFEGILLLTDV